jgi:hypothetical protein
MQLKKELTLTVLYLADLFNQIQGLAMLRALSCTKRLFIPATSCAYYGMHFGYYGMQLIGASNAKPLALQQGLQQGLPMKLSQLSSNAIIM